MTIEVSNPTMLTDADLDAAAGGQAREHVLLSRQVGFASGGETAAKKKNGLVYDDDLTTCVPPD